MLSRANAVGASLSSRTLMVKVSTRDHKFYSSIDLRNYAQEQLGFTGNNMGGQQFDNAMVSTQGGMTKSLSLTQLSTSDPAIAQMVEEEEPKSRVSANLGEYLGAIEDGDDDDDVPFF